ncbi:NAD(P)/FAD-dependent oxidoreductase [Salaquimonas pukyongi]|uniref:NAD(P)/FAD-dependent oxidoreductase n=1 Tax=Salaquimonas pukyongi TaxID=2712698 RepID=UPI00096BA0DE|nr:FAD-binding oxidoreductase [Salaquimonas pukyongi]
MPSNPQGPVNLKTPVRFSDSLPDAVDVVVIGGGVVGVTSALYMRAEGLSVALIEKGRIACEQSSRNWGWVRQHGRDEDELPVMKEASRLWAELDARVKGRAGFKRCGIVYLASSEAELARHEAWLEVAKRHQLTTRLLSAAEVSQRIDQGGLHTAHRWIGATITEDDGRAEPWQAVPAFAELARDEGVLVRENCAARALVITNDRITGVATEEGIVRCEQVLVAAGAWSSLFLQRHGIAIPQLSVRSTVSATAAMPAVFEGCAGDERLAFRRREDGGYTVSLPDLHDLYIGPSAFRHFLKWLPVASEHWRDTRFHVRAPKGFPDGWGTPRNWDEDEESPFERCRVLEPAPNTGKLEKMREAFASRFPNLGKPRLIATWAGMIDAMPDIVPICDRVPGTEGLMLATGMSGHGFGIGPAYGKAMAKIAAGKETDHDMTRFRFSRFTDGSKLRPGPAI